MENTIKRRSFLRTAIVSTAFTALPFMRCSTKLRVKANIILVFIDDPGWADLSCFGNDEIQTPNIDQIAREGIIFEQFYVNSPICSPSRIAISTGTYPQRWRITSYLAHRDMNNERGMAQWLNPAAPIVWGLRAAWLF